MKGQKRAKSSKKPRSKKRKAPGTKPRKKARSAAQRAATKRMLAANRRGRSVRKAPGSKKRKAKKRAARKTTVTTSRSIATNPGKRSKAKRKGVRKSKRRSRRNPGIPTWAMAGLASVAGLAAYAVFGAGSFALTQRMDPSMASLERNRYIAGGIATALGLGLSFVSPVLGAGVMAGGLVGLAGTDLYLAIGKVIDKAPEAPAKGVQGLYNARGQQRLIDGLYNTSGQQKLIQGLGGLYDAGRMSFARASAV